MNYTSHKEAKEAILEAGRRLYARGFVCANDGNISARMTDGTVWVTPTGVSKGFMTEEMLVRLDPQGAVVEGTWTASSEAAMHLALYRENPDIGGIVHAHPAAATAYSTLGRDFDLAISLDAALQVGRVPCAPYAPTGSKALAESAAKYCNEAYAALLEHHGAVTWGSDVLRALYRMECLEQTFTVYAHMRAFGEVRLLTRAQLEELEPVKQKFGILLGGNMKAREDL